MRGSGKFVEVVPAAVEGHQDEGSFSTVSMTTVSVTDTDMSVTD